MMRRMPPQQDTASICLNGHIVNAAVAGRPELNQDYCTACGAQTVTQCKECGNAIRGARWTQGYGSSVAVGLSVRDRPPAFCHACGAPYPWTAARLHAARELAMQLDALAPEEQEALSKSLDDLVRDTPNTSIAANRFKLLVAKAGTEVASMFKDILVGVVTEAAKGRIWS